MEAGASSQEHTDEGPDPFQRCSRVGRSPTNRVRVRHLTEPGEMRKDRQNDESVVAANEKDANKEPTKKPETEYRPAANLPNEDADIIRCRAILKQMKAAMARQPNISVTIKSGIGFLDEYVDRLSEKIRKIEAEAKRSEAEKKEQRTEKRIASSPLKGKGDTAKKTKQAAENKEADGTDWIRVIAKPKKVINQPSSEAVSRNRAEQTEKVRKLKAKNEAILLKPFAGKTYAEVLSAVRSKIKPEDTRAVVQSIRQTRTGAVLVELGPSSTNKRAFEDALRNTLEGTATVREIDNKMSRFET